ncbi:MAG: effector binding domain-containing protein [Anaerolineales bacterium]|nr:effector binding domain-containing protein [Anaerolineales bacterium]
MLKIGEFSQAAKVSIKTLRYYDQMGLLKPAWKDRFSGYRFYHLTQVEDLNQILALKEMGFSLDQIQTILQDEITLPQLKAMLRLKKTELQQEIKTSTSQLALIEDRLNQLDAGADLAQITLIQEPTILDQINKPKELEQMKVEIKTLPAFTTAGMKYVGKNENNQIAAMWQEIGPRWGEINNPAKPYERAFGICGEMEEDGSFTYLAGIQVDKVEDLPADLNSWEVPENTYAVFPCTLRDIHKTYQYAHSTWMPENGYKRADGPDFEYYGEHFDPADPESILYVYIPVKK